jgi:hypothetical protein
MGNRWEKGVVTLHHYRERNWPQGRIVPYQVMLEESNDLIFVPMDIDETIKLLIIPWWEHVFNKPDTCNPHVEELIAESTDKDINETDFEGRTALMEAVARRDRWDCATHSDGGRS